MSLDPLGTVSRVYHFANLTLTDQVKDYIVSISDGSRKQAEVEMVEREDGKMRPKNMALDVFKNSTEVIDAWKDKFYTMVYFWDLYAVEGQCKDMIKTLGKEFFNVDAISTRKLMQLYSAH